ncbi:hypothetical protein D9758_000279 [Tetrapyrgos nigripes]|uniref:J domain-containing protein n=1 Tax=Tetrapyrgos nigripes TaxID=182062 RepID=A0A8H5H205_9AGAR|nr:hypothetical protein D9758_000279 [Tetrapyrgos nigripes]
MFLLRRPTVFSHLRFVSTYGLTRKCPACSNPLPTPLPACSKCWNISSIPNDASFHDIFSLHGSNEFKIDTSLLKQRFREAQSVCHPDTWASKGQDKQETAQLLSARINHAYQTLSNPLSRVEYILEKNGLPMSEEDKIEDMEFLGEIMMRREEIQEADSREEVEEIEAGNEERIADTVKEIERLVDEKKWEKVKEAGMRLRYLEGIRRATRET